MASSNPEQLPFVINCDGAIAHRRSQSFSEGTVAPRSRLRRVVSLRAISAHLDSSGSIPSDHSSLPYGFLTSFDDHNENQVGEKEKANQEWCEPKPQHTDTRSEAFSGRQPHPSSRDGWRAHVLETILEHPSVSTLERAISLKSRPSSILLITRNRYGDKIYSLDDLDIPSFRPKLSFSSLPTEFRRSGQLSSSTWSSQEYLCCEDGVSPAEPLHPIYPAPVRCPTPPGLPSFGTQEAIRLRAPHGVTQSGRRPESDGDLDDCSCCIPGLRRFLGLSSCGVQRSPALPVGAVARATDGTIVRGRFGTRHSGHGVGAGPGAIGLRSHPFHRETLPVANSRDNQRIGPFNHGEGQRQRSMCCTNAVLGSSTLLVPARSSSFRSSNTSRPSSNYPVPRRVHFVDGTTPNGDALTVPVPSYIRHPPLVPPAPTNRISSPVSNRLPSMASNRSSTPSVSPLSPRDTYSPNGHSGPASTHFAAPMAEYNVSGWFWVPEWMAECCGVSIISPNSQRAHGAVVAHGGANDNAFEHRGSLSLMDLWRRGRKASKPWIPAWGCQPFNCG